MNQKKAQSLANRIARRFRVSAPKVKLRVLHPSESAADGWSGRFYPKSKRVAVGVGRRMTEARQRALVGHEVGHKVTRDVYCKKGKRCTYTGEHDHRFYKVTDAIHRIIRTNRRAARDIEAGSGYNPPDGWLAPKRPRARRRSVTGLPR